MKRPLPSRGEASSEATKWIDRPAAREVIPLRPGESFRWLEHDYPSEIARWNYHPEFEIHLIRKGTGSYIIGDQIGDFGPGHVAIIGSELPHDWMSDIAPDEVIVGRDAVVQFDGEWLHRCIDVMPELNPVRELLDLAQRGIVFGGQTAVVAADQIELVGSTTGPQRLSHLFCLLATLTRAPDGERKLVTRGWCDVSEGREGKVAVEAGLEYIFANLGQRIRMSEAARLALMSEPTFSKYFKRASGLTFSETVKKLRIAGACRLLVTSELQVSEICREVGYSNLANFNRQFLAEVGVTPRQYRNLDDDDERRRDIAPRLGLNTAHRRGDDIRT